MKRPDNLLVVMVFGAVIRHERRLAVVVAALVVLGSLAGATRASAQRRGLAPPGATTREQVAAFRDQMRAEPHRPDAPYPTANDLEMEVAFTYCLVTLAARGEEGMLGRDFECLGSTPSNSDWRTLTRNILGDAGLGRGFVALPLAAWDRCIDAMVAAPPARSRHGEALRRYCIPALSERRRGTRGRSRP